MIAPIRQQPIADQGQLRRGLAAELITLAEITADADPDLSSDYRHLAAEIRRGVVTSIVDRLDQLESRLETVLADQEH